MLRSTALDVKGPVAFARPRADGKMKAYDNLANKGDEGNGTVNLVEYLADQVKKGNTMLAISVNKYQKEGEERCAVEFQCFAPKKELPDAKKK